MTKPIDSLLLENQLCFALYSASNAVTRRYRPLLAALDITYSQYLVMMVLWQSQPLSVKALGQRLHLDSGTLTPLLKRLEVKRLLMRRRSEQDERVVEVMLTEAGWALRQQAEQIPAAMRCQVEMSDAELQQLKALCQQVLAQLTAD